MSEGSVLAKELRDRGEDELRSLLENKVEELHKGKLKHAIGQLRETHSLRSLRKDIARLKTVLADKENN